MSLRAPSLEPRHYVQSSGQLGRGGHVGPVGDCLVQTDLNFKSFFLSHRVGPGGKPARRDY
jgi:hypothetical protein